MFQWVVTEIFTKQDYLLMENGIISPLLWLKYRIYRNCKHFFGFSVQEFVVSYQPVYKHILVNCKDVVSRISSKNFFFYLLNLIMTNAVTKSECSSSSNQFTAAAISNSNLLTRNVKVIISDVRRRWTSIILFFYVTQAFAFIDRSRFT